MKGYKDIFQSKSAVLLAGGTWRKLCAAGFWATNGSGL